MKKKYILSSTLVLSLSLITLNNKTNAQNIGINATGGAPDAGAMLDISSTNKGLLIPRVNIANLTTIAPITGSTTTSMLVYNTNTTTGLGYYYWNGTRWMKFSTGGDAWELLGNAGTTAANFLGTTDNNPIAFRTNNVERMRVLANGNIGIKTNNPIRMLQMTNGGVNVGAAPMAEFLNNGIDGVALSGINNSTTSTFNSIEGATNYGGNGGNPAAIAGIGISTVATNTAIGVRGAVNGGSGVGVQGSKQLAGGLGWGGLFINDLGYVGGFFNASDRRLKKDVATIEDAISIIGKLSPVTYTYDLEKYPSMGLNPEKEFGFIAQEMQEVLPEIVREKLLPTNGTEEVGLNKKMENKNELFLTMDYTRLIPLAIQGIKEQQVIIESQNDRIEALEKMVLELQEAIKNK